MAVHAAVVDRLSLSVAEGLWNARTAGVGMPVIVKVRVGLDQEIAAVRDLCRDLGLANVRSTLLKAAHHTTLLLEPVGLVARVQSSEPLVWGLERAERELQVSRHLAVQDAPAIRPCGGKLGGPHVRGAMVVTFWPFMEHQKAGEETDAIVAADALTAVHDALQGYGGKLPSYAETLDRCWRLLSDDSALPELPSANRSMLTGRYSDLRRRILGTAPSYQPLHGDAHLGNLLLTRQGPVWTDFEDACVGPVEYDVAALPTAAWAAFPNADPSLVRTFAALRSVCVAVWCWADVSRSDENREAAEHHLEVVRARVVRG